jgi:hypothetical protein
MRVLALSSALLMTAVMAVPPAAEAARPKTMTVTLASGKKVTFHLMKIHGKMMMVLRLEDFPSGDN